ncbi:major facilitator superfamily domain-containing protein [Clohesyomyces aquaticus]|uniref:Major facilitator superfamily domain-containing protein n=1 Tax=Clohesyomyces aquaticus TaxID=1231657 RepID=A0A1Y2AAE0_9PLEO|nr:major facilitator superfamily domain-containing protein [Clohesyomyces aquaticus]
MKPRRPISSRNRAVGTLNPLLHHWKLEVSMHGSLDMVRPARNSLEPLFPNKTSAAVSHRSFLFTSSMHMNTPVLGFSIHHPSSRSPYSTFSYYPVGAGWVTCIQCRFDPFQVARDMVSTLSSRISAFLGIPSLAATGRDAYLIITLRCLRMFSAGIPSLILALFFSSLDFSDTLIGAFMTLTLLGDVLLSLCLTLITDSLGRRRILFFGSVMMVFSGTVFALFENFWILLGAAVVGVISVTGADCGPFRAVEESVLSGLTNEHTRSDVLTWYVMATNMANAVGTEVAGRVVHALEKRWKGEEDGERRVYHVLFWGYAGFGASACLVCLGLSTRCEIQQEKKGTKERGRQRGSGREEEEEEEEEVLLDDMSPSSPNIDSSIMPLPKSREDQPRRSLFTQISTPTRSIMYKLWFLLAIDSLADGMIPYSLMNYYVDMKFHLPKTMLGDITSGSQFLCAVSSIFAGPLSRKIGLINTMVFTHLPSSLTSAFIPLPQKVGWTVALLLFRAALNSMDQAPRTSFIAAVVKPEERTGVMGITSMLRTLAMSSGPTVTGVLAGNDKFWIAFLVAGICRVGYDLGLFTIFVNVKLHQHEGEQSEDEGVWDSEDLEGLLSGSEIDEESIVGLGKGKESE